jgi:hypothetical protein
LWLLTAGGMYGHSYPKIAARCLQASVGLGHRKQPIEARKRCFERGEFWGSFFIFPN